MRINGSLIDSHNFGYVGASNPEQAVLTGTYNPPSTGLYTLEIQNYNSVSSTSKLTNYVDTVIVEPVDWTLGSDGVTFAFLNNSPRNFDLKAGPGCGNKDYWLWVGISGTYPGLNVKGVAIPLNYDIVVNVGWMLPGAIGTGFVGTLNAQGDATASWTFKPDLAMKGLTFYLSYVVLSSGMSLPVLAASNPINITCTFIE